MSNKSLIALIVGVVLALVAWNSFYIVSQTERAVLLQFGRIVQPDVQPGLHVKVPYVNQVRKFDARLLTLDTLLHCNLWHEADCRRASGASS